MQHSEGQEKVTAFHLISSQGGSPGSVPLPDTLNFTGGVSWHPGGTKVAFAAGRNWGGYDIYSMTLSHGNPVLVVSDGIQPAWSPDGKLLAFTTYRDSNLEIYLADLEAQNLRNLTEHVADDSRPSWSPDSRRVVFESKRFGNLEICIQDIDSGNLTRLTNDPAKDRNPVWSPGGQEIGFVSDRGGTDGIYRMGIDGSDITLLSSHEGDRQLNWSPDGQTLCFVSSRPEPFLDWLMRSFFD